MAYIHEEGKDKHDYMQLVQSLFAPPSSLQMAGEYLGQIFINHDKFRLNLPMIISI